MDFDLNEEQRLLKDSIDRFMSDAYGDFEKRKAHQAGPGGYSAGLWAGLAELGVLALPFAEEDGGIGGGPVETMIVMEAIGRGLAVEPYLSTVVLGGGFLRLGGTDALRAELVPQVADGSLTLAFAQLEPRSATTCTTCPPPRGAMARVSCWMASRPACCTGTAQAGWWSAPAPPARGGTGMASRCS
ncbi:acyl-CoA dehydrogenase family protein [Pseudoroseomonas wenyumeiae]